MPAKTTKSSLFSRIGKQLKKAHDAHKGDDKTFAARGDLPDGINNGIAQLVDVHIGQYESGDNEGKDFIYFGSVVLAPQIHNNIPIEGLRASVIEPLCDTPGKSRESFEDHWDWVLTLLRTSFGVNTEELDVENLEEFFEALVEEAPKHRFRTWTGKPTKAYPNPRVNVDFGAAVTYDAAPSSDVEQDDDTEDETEEDEETSDEADESDAEESDEEEVDLAALAKAADKDDEEAQRKLEELAEAAGVPTKKVEKAGSWKAVVKMIEAAEAASAESDEEESDEESGDEEAEESDEEESDEEAEDEAEEEYAVGNVYMYKVPGSKKPVEVEIVKINEKAKTATVKDLNTDKTVVGKDKKPLAVKLSDLQEQD